MTVEYDRRTVTRMRELKPDCPCDKDLLGVRGLLPDQSDGSDEEYQAEDESERV